MKRWPIIRHIRWFWYMNQLRRWWNSVGKHYWLTPNLEDIQFLNDVWEGRE